MSDARRTYQPSQTETHEVQGKTKKKYLPRKRKPSERIAKMPKPPKKGPGESTLKPISLE